MKPKSIYNSKRLGESFDIDHLADIFEELSRGLDLSLNTRVKVVTHLNHGLLSGRGLSVFSLWYNESPFAIVQNAGRAGRDEWYEIITSDHWYKMALRYLLRIANVVNHRNTARMATDVPALDNLYQHKLSIVDGEIIARPIERV